MGMGPLDQDERDRPVRGHPPASLHGRREFLRTTSHGLIAAGLLGQALWGKSGSRFPGIAPGAENEIERDSRLRGQFPGKPLDVVSRVGLARGQDRREIVYKALELIEDDVRAAVDRKRRVLIKPNMAVDKNPLATTHVDAARAVLDFLRPRCRKPIVVAESGVLNTADGFRNNGYFALEKEYGVKVVDLNAAPDFRRSYVVDTNHVPRVIRTYRALSDPETCVISLARMKTHDTVLVTLSLKNVLMAAPVNDYQKSDKGVLHGATKAVDDIMHYNLFHLAEQGVWPDLAVIDGFESMEGHGPAWGTPLATRLALAARDPLAADVVGTTIMGFDPGRILYLKAMADAGMGRGDLGKIKVLGAPLDGCRFHFKVGETMAKVYQLST